jgi:hypothetical protein
MDFFFFNFGYVSSGYCIHVSKDVTIRGHFFEAKRGRQAKMFEKYCVTALRLILRVGCLLCIIQIIITCSVPTSQKIAMSALQRSEMKYLRKY